MILSGGAGTRLWPLSRTAMPKQFLKFGGKYSLFQNTLLRCSDPFFDPRPIIVTQVEQRFLIASNVNKLGQGADIVLEPQRRNSCAAVVTGALRALQRDPNAVVLVMAADHHIPDFLAFRRAVAEARTDAETGYIVTFGITPNHPATGYGYIKPGSLLSKSRSAGVDRFVEKPDCDTAFTYIQEGYFWNSGNFLSLAATLIEEAEKFVPDVVASARLSLERSTMDDGFLWLEETAYAAVTSNSFDYAIMEKTNRAAVYRVDHEWSDIGSWGTVWELMEKDRPVGSSRLVFDGMGNVVLEDALDGFVVMLTPITIEAGASHGHRLPSDTATSWTVLHGEVEIESAGKIQSIKANETAHVPFGVGCRISNNATYPAQMLQVQARHFA